VAAAHGALDHVTGAREARGIRHVLVAICDHFEPTWTGDPRRPGVAEHAQAKARVAAWTQGYPALAADYRDADGRPPRHTFFYPGEQYHPELVEPLAELVERGLGELEVHLHHDGDTAQSLAASLEAALVRYERHGLVARVGSARRFAFIHGNWCLANARRDGRHCGVDDELAVLHQLGCYADLTFPSAPDETQPAIVNSIYYPMGDVRRRRAHSEGVPVSVGTPKEDKVLLMQGPLALARRAPRSGGLPIRLDAAALTAKDPPTVARLRTWIDQGVHVAGRSEWIFLKLHTHGAPEDQARMLLGEPQRRFHEALADLGRSGQYAVHYVTARELFNLARAAMDGRAGEPGRWRDYEVPPPPRARRRMHV
jgi:hypothetical protein